MARLRLILGLAGSGKTETVLREAALESIRSPLGPPLLIIVPEQQGVQTERAVLARIAELSAATDQSAATARIRVLSLTRLARLLLENAGRQYNKLSELQRRLLVFGLLEPGRERQARALVYSDLLAELALWQTEPRQLEQRAKELRISAGVESSRVRAQSLERLAGKLELLAQLQQRYISVCDARGLDFRPAAGLIPELLMETNWPGLAQTQVWVDGFAGFTPAEESALEALLKNCKQLSATLLLDPLRKLGPLPSDSRDWYAPTRELYERWQLLAQRCGAGVPEELPPQPPQRWAPGSPLYRLASDSMEATASLPDWPTPEPRPALPGSLGALACSDEREEVRAAAQEIRRLCLPPEEGGAGLRFGQISVVLRGLERYAPLVQTTFHDYKIPFFLDQRRSLAHHPAVELLRSGLRLALGLAGNEDVAALLRCGLLPGLPEDEQRDAVDHLLAYARSHGLRPGQWLSETPWQYRLRLLRGEEAVDEAAAQERQEKLDQLNRWRGQLLGPLRALARELNAIGQPLQMAGVLKAAWQALFSTEVGLRLEDWALRADASTAAAAAEEWAANEPAQLYRPDQSELHRAVWPALVALVDGLAKVAQDLPLSAGELCAWLEAGLAALDTGFPPTLLDSVLVTQIDRGRHGPIAHSLLLGLSEDQWPASQQESALFSDFERRLINRVKPGEDAAVQVLAQQPASPALLGSGASEQAQREPYLLLVAATRPSRGLYLSRPAGGSDGRVRPESPYYITLLNTLDIEEQTFAQLSAADPRPILPAAELVASLADGGLETLTPALQTALRRAAPGAWLAARWSRELRSQRGNLPPLSPATLEALLGRGGRLRLRASASQLEAFALCPFRHLSRYFLRLSEDTLPLFDARTLGSFYHSLFERLIIRLRQVAGGDWGQVNEQTIERQAALVLDELALELPQETDYQRIEFLLLRARALLNQHAQQLLSLLHDEQRRPLATELGFGERPGLPLPALSIDFPGGQLLLSGKIDRVDLDPAGQATVVDYKLGQRDFKDQWLLAGAQVQMYIYLLALAQQAEAGTAAQQSILPLDMAAHSAAYQSIEPRWKDDEHFEVHETRRELAGEEAGEWEAAARGAPKLKPSLELVRRLLSGQGSAIVGGEIRALPLRDGQQWNACNSCDFRAICRFDPLGEGRYRQLQKTAEANLKATGLEPQAVAKPERKGVRGAGR